MRTPYETEEMPHSFLPGWIRRSAHQVLKVKDVWTLVCAGVIGMQLQKPVLVRSPASGIRDRPRAAGIQDGGYRSCWTISQEKRPMIKSVLAFNSLFCCFPRPLQWGDGVSCQTVGNCITAARGWHNRCDLLQVRTQIEYNSQCSLDRR